MSASGSPPFGRIGVVGVGLIGGSICATVRAAWPGVDIAGVDRPDVLSTAMARGLISSGRVSVAEIADVDLIVLATPVPEIIRMIAAVAETRTRALVTDTGSTKREVLRAAAAHPGLAFVGGHPMAGSEFSGITASRADLFAGRSWLIVPGTATPDPRVSALEQFVGGLGARAERVDADTHDRTMAYLSHLPQLLGVGLVNVAGAALGDTGLRLSGRAFTEMTRLAASPPDLWRGILATNADYVSEAAAALSAALRVDPAQLTEGSWTDETFHQANAWRRQVVKTQS